MKTNITFQADASGRTLLAEWALPQELRVGKSNNQGWSSFDFSLSAVLEKGHVYEVCFWSSRFIMKVEGGVIPQNLWMTLLDLTDKREIARSTGPSTSPAQQREESSGR
jgi:hypothetical protein